MAQQQQFLTDGSSDFSGGMDSGRSSSFIDRNQYSLAINTQLPDSFGGLQNRNGLRCLIIDFDTVKAKETYENGNYQGEGSYFDGQQYHILASVDGWIFDFKLINNIRLKGTILNPNNQNNPNNLHCWITQVPFGVVISDGESPNFYLYKGAFRRVTKTEMPPSLMGVYVQNRLCYVLPDRQNIWVSDIENPVGITEILGTNIFGFQTPEPNYFIQAIGKQQTILSTATGGNLSWATNKTQYSVNIVGARTNWGTANGSGIGFVNNTVTDIGAVSSFSYEPFNGNIYFRNAQQGLSSIKLAEYQFINQDTYFTGSPEANLFFNQDNAVLLSKCYTRGFGAKIYTTIAPQLKDNFIYNNGIIVYSPNQYYTNTQRANRRFESVWTGVRPWALTVVDDYGTGQAMFIHSYDYDGVNRIYAVDTTLDHDIDKDGNIVEIESKILTRSFNFGNDLQLKQTEYAFYSLKDIPRNLNVSIDTRIDEHGKLLRQWEFTHKVNPAVIVTNLAQEKCFLRKPVHSENRDLVPVAQDPEECGGTNYFIRQDLFTFTGAYTLRRWARIATQQDVNKIPIKEEPNNPPNVYTELMLYTYKLS